MEASTEKRCSQCQQVKPLSAFYPAQLGKYGVSSYCKKCVSDKWKEKYREEHPTAKPLHNTVIDPVKGWGFVSVKSLEDRFWEKVDKNTCLGETCGCHKGLGHCWPWTGHRNRQGYGLFSYGVGKKKTKGVPAHVKAWELVNYPMEDSQIGCHHCDNPPCANPGHIFPGTYKENIADMLGKGRGRKAKPQPIKPGIKTIEIDFDLIMSFSPPQGIHHSLLPEKLARSTRWSTTIRPCNLDLCQRPFRPKLSILKKGKGIYCSKPCQYHASTRLAAKRFWEYVDIINDLFSCWPWKGTIDEEQGYGSFSINDHKYRAHRISYALIIGPIPKGLLVLHACDNGLCVRPEHLFLGTQVENIADAITKGRMNFQRIADLAINT